MRILFDYNNLACRCAHIQQVRSDDERGWSLMAYMVFNTMYNFLSDVAESLDVANTGEKLDVILALDSKDGYWRREFYPPYKADRSAKRSNDGLDWERAYTEFDRLSSTIQRCIPWKVLCVDKCEADDIIYTLAVTSSEPVIIHSSDSDYLQLVSDNVSLFRPNIADYVEFPCVCKISNSDVFCKTSEEYLQYAILTGQGGKDNVYNVKTDTNWCVTQAKRKPGFGVKAASKVLATADYIQELQRIGLWENYLRNKRLIDMSELPEEYRCSILHSYETTVLPTPSITTLLDVYPWASLAAQVSELEATLQMWSEGIRFNKEQHIEVPSAEPIAMEFSL